VRLQVGDIDAQRDMLRIEQGKGRKDRSTLLGPRLLAPLRQSWQVYPPVRPWLFPQRNTPLPMDPSTAQRLYYTAKRRAGITKAGGIPALRHAFATQAVEGGMDLATLPRLLGPDSITTTLRSVHGAHHHATAQGSPLESLPELLPLREAMPQLSSPPTATGSAGHRPPPPFEGADIVREYGEAFRATQPVSHEQARVMRAIAHCRTAALGGHLEVCEACGRERVC
jgi:hypothetical protein